MQAEILANLLAERVRDLETLSQMVPGGFERTKEDVKQLVNNGMPFPEALYQVAQDIIKGEYNGLEFRNKLL